MSDTTTPSPSPSLAPEPKHTRTRTRGYFNKAQLEDLVLAETIVAAARKNADAARAAEKGVAVPMQVTTLDPS